MYKSPCTVCLLWHSVNLGEVQEARRKGEQKREFDLLQAHLKDLFYNKALIVTQLNNEEVCSSAMHGVYCRSYGFVLCFTQREKENAEKKQREEIERLNDNDEVIIEVHIVHIQLPIHYCALIGKFHMFYYVLVISQRTVEIVREMLNKACPSDDDKEEEEEEEEGEEEVDEESSSEDEEDGASEENGSDDDESECDDEQLEEEVRRLCVTCINTQ